MAAHRRQRRAIGALGQPVLCVGFGDLDKADELGRVWVEVCIEGTYRGHAKFPELNWTKEVFDQIVANFRAHPGYVVGTDGFGAKRLVPWDYEHQSEIAKSTGNIPANGVPAEAWTYDVEVRMGDDGKARLFELVEWLEDARAQILAGKYQYCSIAVAPKYVNPVTGVDQGPTLTSTALTNDPFIQGMEPIAATLEQWGPAESLLEVLVGLRSAFELPEDAAAADVLQQIRIFLDAIIADAVPEYVEEGFILDRIRRLLKLPLLSTPEQILGGAEAAVNELISGEGKGAATAPTVTPPLETQMPTLNSLVLATVLGCADTEPAILQAVKEAAKKAEAAEASKTAVDAIEQLKNLLGGNDTQELVAKATQLLSDAKKLEPALKALAEASAALKEGAVSEAEAETEAVAASLAGTDPEQLAKFRPVILAARMACIDSETGKVDVAKLEKFRKDFPLKEEHKALLTRRVVAGPNGVQLGGSSTALNTQPITQSNGGAKSDVQKVVDEINATPGPNPIAKMNTWLCSRNPDHAKLSWADQNRVAGEKYRGILEGKLPL